MSYQLSTSSLRKLEGVHSDLVRVVKRAIEITPQDFSVVFGLRTKAEQMHLVSIGASHAPNSPHLAGLAVDLQPYLGPGVDPYPRKGDTVLTVRAKLARFEEVARAMFQAADDLEVDLQWGNDWDMDGIPTGKDPDERGYLQDLVHFQTPPFHRQKQAAERRAWRIAARAAGHTVLS